jgi:hypothetical protein
VVMVKGSAGSRMSRVVTHLEDLKGDTDKHAL